MEETAAAGQGARGPFSLLLSAVVVVVVVVVVGAAWLFFVVVVVFGLSRDCSVCRRRRRRCCWSCSRSPCCCVSPCGKVRFVFSDVGEPISLSLSLFLCVCDHAFDTNIVHALTGHVCRVGAGSGCCVSACAGT